MKWISTIEKEKWLESDDFSAEKGEELTICEAIGKEIYGFGACFNEIGMKAIFSLSAEKQEEIEALFADRIKEEIEHTIKIAERAETDLFGILPRLYQQEPALAKGISREALWQSLVIEIQPQLELKDMGRKR